MVEKFSALSPREKILVVIMLILFGLFILLQLIILPLTNYHKNAETAQVRAQKERLYVEQNISRINKQGTASQTREPLSRASIISTSRAAGIERLNRIQPQPNGDLKLWVDDVPASALFGFLNNVEARYLTQVTGAQITRQEGGLISAQISLSMPNQNTNGG